MASPRRLPQGVLVNLPGTTKKPPKASGDEDRAVLVAEPGRFRDKRLLWLSGVSFVAGRRQLVCRVVPVIARHQCSLGIGA